VAPAEEVVVLVCGDAVLRDDRRVARQRGHRLSAAPYPGPADRAFAASWILVTAGLVPAIIVDELVVRLTGFTVALFFLGFAIAPLWTATMDIAPNYAGSSSALMNAAGAVAGILSPVAFGWLLDRTGS
jgi:MFS family permease